MTKLRSRLPYRKRPTVRVTAAEIEIRGVERIAQEMLAVSRAEPRMTPWDETANEAYEVYESICATHGVCRSFGCYRRTKLRHCKEHRSPAKTMI